MDTKQSLTARRELRLKMLACLSFFLSFFQRRLTLHEVEHVFFFRVVGPGFKQGPHNVLCGLKDVIFGSSSVTSSYLGRPQYTL